MNGTTIKIDMKPSHPGDFIRTEILNELGLTITKAASILGVGLRRFPILLTRILHCHRRWLCGLKKLF